jgi:hypothetical protein
MVTVRSLLRTVAIALGVLVGIFAAECGRDNGPEAQEQRELRFYQREPGCPERQAAYLTFRTGATATELHRVWVCGYRRER